MRVVPVPCLSDNYAYLLIADGEAAVVDPSEAVPVQAAAAREGVRLRAILNTHHHWDHVGGNEGLLQDQPDLPVYGHESDLARGRIPGQTVGLPDGAERTVLGRRVQALHIPGHTLGAVAYFFPDEGVVFTGDTLFGAGCGRLFEGTPEMMFASLQRLCGLPEATQVYCGHEYTERNLAFAAAVEPQSAAIAAISARQTRVRALRAQGLPSVPSTLAEERETNPFLRAPDAARFAELRRLKDTF
jgi:hydroxyacylglutathione hydrolase